LDTSKDLVVAVLGAAVALAGLLLVFSGFLFSQADSLPPETTDNSTIRSYKKAARIGIAPFVGCLALAGIAGAWLHAPGPVLFHFVWAGFGTLLVVTGVYGAWVILRQLS
jgi:hypothetical protein